MFERCLYFNTQALARSVEKIWREAYAQVGLSPSHAYIVRAVLQQPGINMSELAQTLNLDKSTLTRLVDKLEQQALLQRQTEGQSRQRCLRPTPAAEALGPELEAIGQRLFEHVQTTVSSAELSAFPYQAAAIRQQLADSLPNTANHAHTPSHPEE